jgi:hypothetical protein
MGVNDCKCSWNQLAAGLSTEAFEIIKKYSKHTYDLRISINRPTKRGKENSRSDGHCQCFCKYIHTIHINTQPQFKQICTQMFALCGNRTRNLLSSRRVFLPLRQIGHQIDGYPSDDRFLRSLLTFCVCTLSALTAGHRCPHVRNIIGIKNSLVYRLIN